MAMGSISAAAALYISQLAAVI